MVDDADAVAALHLLDVMGGDDDGEIALLAQRLHVLPQPPARLRIEADGRLVEEQHAGVMDERARDLEPSFHAGRERPHQAVAPLRELDQMQHLVDPALAPRRRHAIDEAVEIEVLVHGQAIVERGLLEHHAEAAPRLQRMGDDVDAADPRGAAVGLEDGAEDVEQRGLAGAVRAEQREQLVRPHREADIVQRQRAAIALGHAVDHDLRHGTVRHRPPLPVCANDARISGRFRIISPERVRRGGQISRSPIAE